jgi:CO/xanthine dehydrogenase FAD-binding subunit
MRTRDEWRRAINRPAADHDDRGAIKSKSRCKVPASMVALFAAARVHPITSSAWFGAYRLSLEMAGHKVIVIDAAKQRLLGATAVEGAGTSCIETAAGRRMDRVGTIAFEDDALLARAFSFGSGTADRRARVYG